MYTVTDGVNIKQLPANVDSAWLRICDCDELIVGDANHYSLLQSREAMTLPADVTVHVASDAPFLGPLELKFSTHGAYVLRDGYSIIYCKRLHTVEHLYI